MSRIFVLIDCGITVTVHESIRMCILWSLDEPIILLMRPDPDPSKHRFVLQSEGAEIEADAH